MLLLTSYARLTSRSARASASRQMYNPLQMLLRIILLLWFVAFVLLWFAKSRGRTLMARLFMIGFCLFLVWAFIRVASRLI
jgi:hypothetical protein